MRRLPIVRTVLAALLAALPATADAPPPVTVTAGEVPFEALFDEALQPKLTLSGTGAHHHARGAGNLRSLHNGPQDIDGREVEVSDGPPLRLCLAEVVLETVHPVRSEKVL